MLLSYHYLFIEKKKKKFYLPILNIRVTRLRIVPIFTQG